MARPPSKTPSKTPSKASSKTIALKVTRAGSRRFELRDDRGMVLDVVDSRLAAVDLVNAMRRELVTGWKIEVAWVGCDAP